MLPKVAQKLGLNTLCVLPESNFVVTQGLEIKISDIADGSYLLRQNSSFDYRDAMSDPQDDYDYQAITTAKLDDEFESVIQEDKQKEVNNEKEVQDE